MALSNYYKPKDRKVLYTGNNRFEPYNVNGVEMPEHFEVTHAWHVQYAEITQKGKISTVMKQNGRTHVPLDELVGCKVLSWKYVQNDTEQVILCGDFCSEDDEKPKKDGRKLLVNRMQKLLQPMIKDKGVESMYSKL